MDNPKLNCTKRTVIKVNHNDWNKFITEVYGKPYNFQQQDGCRSRGVYDFSLPFDFELYDEEEDFLDFVDRTDFNKNQSCVKFSVWKDEKVKYKDPDKTVFYQDEYEDERLYWVRAFYPNLYTLLDDLYKKGLLEDGDYELVVSW